MLDLTQAFAGCPPSSLSFLHLPRETLLLYPFADSVVIFNARTLAFIRALALWEVFPSTRNTLQSVQCLTVENSMKLVVASLGRRVVAWSLSGKRHDYWRVHSSLSLPEDQQVTALNCMSGLLAVGTRTSLSVYTLILENDLPTWSLKWSSDVPTLSRVRYSPSLMYIATTSLNDNVVRTYLTTTGRQTQALPHPRPVIDLIWRNSPTSSRDDPILYTITSDATLRIFMPVIDSPQYLQLHTALDTFSSLPFAVACKQSRSSVFWLDREIVSHALEATIEDPTLTEEDARRRRVREIAEEGWDIFLRVLEDGSIVVQAVANIDRRPPTLLKHFALLETAPKIVPGPPHRLYVVPNLSRGSLTLVTSPPLTTYDLPLLSFLGTRESRLTHLASGADHAHIDVLEADDSRAEIVQYARTPNGEGSGILESTAKWSDDDSHVDLFVVIDAGHNYATYSKASSLLTLHTNPPATLTVPPLTRLFALSAPHAYRTRTLVGVATSQEVLLISAVLSGPTPSLRLISQGSLPLPSPSKTIIPVDPMAWVGQLGARTPVEHDVLLSVSEDGDLTFWRPEINLHSPSNGYVIDGKMEKQTVWKCTGHVRTRRKGFIKASCSSAKKSVLIAPTAEGEELTIWDSQESEFSLGLEYRQIIDPADPVRDLDWTATPDNQSILAVGFAHRIELLCQQRATYFDEIPGWGVCWRIDMGRTLLVGAGHFQFMFGQTPLAGERAVQTESLFEHVARLNGPLDDYNPQMILQCLLWGKVELVKEVIVNLARNIDSASEHQKWQTIPIERYLQKDSGAMTRSRKSEPVPPSVLLKSLIDVSSDDDDDPFSSQMVRNLLGRLEDHPIPHFTPLENVSLMELIQTTLEVLQRALDPNGLRYLLSMRYFYNINRRASEPSSPSSGINGADEMNGVNGINGTTDATYNGRLRRRERLRYRDMIWAFHSESQDLLLSTANTACGGKMCWPDARALGVFMWIRSQERMRAHMEVVARNQYMAGDNRDPSACSLLYFALGKVKLVHGLWRQAVWHKEQQAMLKFLNNDFTQPRWRTAAQKNAFALLSKRRFEYAAAFFLLGGSLKDAITVCLKNIGDWQLAVALIRVMEGDDSALLKDILDNTVIPLAFKDGNRYLASWVFWMLRRRDLAVRILVMPLQDVASELEVSIPVIGDPHYDDPSLALLFSQLKAKTLQTAQGTSEISGRTEFNFVLQTARVFCKMGCHALALDMVRTWSFQRPSTVVRDSARALRRPPSPVSTRFALEPALRRQSSILIDIDVSTAPPTRHASPSSSPTCGVSPVTPMKVKEELKEEGDLVARKAGIGSLMKSAKQDVKVPEFDMDAFF
ncbi:RAVE protein 1 C terminal-domain-containing protein [Epithele typhae]|uniref:RAVE protein 1 C terminal-domain-containing protein n=1 Tax=Epithele typhae TaxID=378194 RepID=UPI0020081C0B|nr:RAVE protein 1 C terminal-domain-containing protein [Epithele typhae]KAH9944024.1 RAVE protein 1 C terminal-domain-containing protein [Epithele typhae]